ncbi:DUF6691 family protein [Acidocella sp.]|uniref:DUF6691 family protein n=1 Tax=Acidocella sp. TaxID=50710 RepID=UPI00260195D3|nr:DUF6691 family protein [Acidocella sp.]
MKQAISALVAGTLFGAGLALSGMANPAKVLGFLNIFGAWNPTLIFVMAGAMIPMGIAWRIQARLRAPLSAHRFNLSNTSKPDAKLVVGAVLFGVGWGIAGLCPGAAIADVSLNPHGAIVFVLAMLTGMGTYKIIVNQSAPETNKPQSTGGLP